MLELHSQHTNSKRSIDTIRLPQITMRKVLLILVTFWVIIYSNSRMLEGVGTYNIVHLFPIPRIARIAELALLFFLFVLAFTIKMPKRIFIISICTALYLILSLGNLMIRGNFNFDAVQDIYIRVAPFLLFTILAQGRIADRRELLYFVRFFCIVLVLNLLVFLFIQLPTGDHEDHFAGLFEDAHLFCNFLLTFSATFFYDYLKTKRKLHLIFSIGLIIVSLFPSNEKVIAFTLVIFGLLFLWNLIRRQNVIGKIIIIFSILLLVFVGFKYVQNKDGGELWVRAQMMYDMFGVGNIGPIIAWPMALNEIQESQGSFFFGLGAGEYGWIAASRNVMEGRGSVHSKLFEFEFNNENINNAGYLFRTNTWSSLLAEFGLFGFLAFVWALFSIIKGVRQSVTRNRLEANLKFAFYFILIIVIYQGFFTPYSNWSVSVLMFPAMYLAAFFHKQPKQEKQLVDVR
jgi:hypothetical protein